MERCIDEKSVRERKRRKDRESERERERERESQRERDREREREERERRIIGSVQRHHQLQTNHRMSGPEIMKSDHLEAKGSHVVQYNHVLVVLLFLRPSWNINGVDRVV